MALLGLILIAFGITDFAMSWMGTDVWADWLGIELPDLLYRFSAIIEIAIGSQLLKMGDDAEGSESEMSEGHNIGQKDDGGEEDWDDGDDGGDD